MRNILILVFTLFGFFAHAQENTLSADQIIFPTADASPADIVYYPLNAAKVKPNDPTKPIIKIIYSRPQKKGREIFGVLEQFDKVWRLGANENTEIKFYKNVTIGDKKIKAGTYSLFTVPGKDNWTLIINKDVDKWGAFSYNQLNDVVRVEVPVKQLGKTIEYLSLTFTKLDKGANLVIGWDKTFVELPISF